MDLGSSDNSLEIASSIGWDIIVHQRVPFVEIIHEQLASKFKFDWVLYLDPDERAGPGTGEALRRYVTLEGESLVGAIRVPCDYYFKRRRLVGTPWGFGNTRRFLVNKTRVSFKSEVHRGTEIIPGFREVIIEENGAHIQHFWSDSWRNLFSKHIRYLRSEGESKFSAGRRTSLFRALVTPWRVVLDTIRHKAPFRDGPTGIGLSSLWVIYKSAVEWALLLHQHRVKTHK